MAGKKKQPPTSPRPVAPLSGPEAQAKVAELRAEGDKLYLARSFTKAVESYEQAIKLTQDAPEKAELQLKAAGVYLAEKRFKDAIKATTAVLEQAPSSAAALRTRSKAYESMGFLKQALSDAQAVNKGPGATDETREMERRLRDAMSTNRARLSASVGGGSGGGAGGGGAGASGNGPSLPGRSQDSAAAAAAQQAQQQAAQQQQQRNAFPYMVTVKASLGDETRVVHASLAISYGELLEQVRAKFPHAGPLLLKYTDKQGDEITLTSRNDVQTCIAELAAEYQRQVQSGATKLSNNNQLPPLRLKVVKVASEAEVPRPPADEGYATKAKEGAQAQQQFEIDEWLVQFAKLFTEVTGIDPSAHQEHLALGHDKIFKAVDASLSDPKAQPLFDKAGEHFREAASTSFVQWGNVHIIRADRQAQALLKANQPMEGKALEAMLKEYDESEKKFNEALRIKPDSWEANGSLGQLEWERAKAKIGYIMPAPTAEESGKEGEDAAAAKEKLAEAVKAALARIDAKKVGQVQKHMDNVTKLFEKGLALAKAADEKKRAEDAAAAAADGAEAQEPAELTSEQKLQSPAGNMLVMHGNIVYEWSQVMAAIGKPWKPTLDSAVEKFRAAGAAEPDVRAALKNHCMVAELDLGPDPEPEKAAEGEAKSSPSEEDKSKAPEAKGLPSLEVKKKAKA